VLIEVIEDNHYKLKRELKTRLESVSLTRDQEFEVYKKKVESDKAAMQRSLANKNKELQEIRGELDILLKEIDELRGGLGLGLLYSLFIVDLPLKHGLFILDAQH
jgi:hypothetical protein